MLLQKNIWLVILLRNKYITFGNLFLLEYNLWRSHPANKEFFLL
jgi:hypothetical protein